MALEILLAPLLMAGFLIGVYAFSGRRVTWNGIKEMCSRYRYHFFMLIGVMIGKSSILLLEPHFEPYSVDLTRAIYGIEGDWIFWVQQAFRNDALTLAAITVYLLAFLFAITFSFSFFAYLGKTALASKLALLNMVLLLLSIPFYLFVVVYVPTYPKMFDPGAATLIPGMEPLLYNHSPLLNDFFVRHESFNNCFPSMHIGFPAAILMMLAWREKGFLTYKAFLFLMLISIGFSIIYLGVHWLLDIAGGLAMAFAGVVITDRCSGDVWRRIGRLHRRGMAWWHRGNHGEG